MFAQLKLNGKYIETNIGVNTELERFSGFYLFKSWRKTYAQWPPIS